MLLFVPKNLSKTKIHFFHDFLGTKSNDYIVISFCNQILVNFYNICQTKKFMYTKSCNFKKKIHSSYKKMGTKSNDYIDVTFCTQKLVNGGFSTLPSKTIAVG